MGSSANMIRSMLVIGGLLLVLIAMVPRISSVQGEAVDVNASAVTVVQDTGWPIVEARGLPAGWSETSARYVRSSDGLMTWHAGYQAPSGRYVAVEQTQDATQDWVSAQTNRARQDGKVVVDDVTWLRYVRDGKVQNSLLDRRTEPGELTTLVTGTATFEEMEDFIGYLRPVDGSR